MILFGDLRGLKNQQMYNSPKSDNNLSHNLAQLTLELTSPVVIIKSEEMKSDFLDLEGLLEAKKESLKYG